MQMKMPKKIPKLNTAKMRQLLEQENEFITNFMAMFDVPESVHDDHFDEQFLLKSKKPNNQNKKNAVINKNRAQSADALQERLETMKNKIGSKKAKPSERTLKKRQLKKLKKDKEFKKKMVSVAKSMKNEKAKEEKATIKNDPDDEVGDNKKDIKSKFNAEGKIVFSKFDFAAQPSKAKKSKKDKVEKNPKILLHKIIKQKKEINQLIESGEGDKAAKIKTDLAWQKAFDKTSGKKVKDNTTLLHKTIKRKKVMKKKSKTDWKKREEVVAKDIKDRQKKRSENIKKKTDEKKKNKLKKLAKRGRIIPGYG